jgi:hypothetical protein
LQRWCWELIVGFEAIIWAQGKVNKLSDKENHTLENGSKQNKIEWNTNRNEPNQRSHGKD